MINVMHLTYCQEYIMKGRKWGIKRKLQAWNGILGTNGAFVIFCKIFFEIRFLNLLRSVSTFR